MEENKTFEITAKFEVLDPEEVEVDDVVDETDEIVINEELNDKMVSKVSNALIFGAVFATSMAVTCTVIKLYDKVKTKRINKELGRIKEELIEQFTKNGTIENYTDDTLDELSKYIYFKKHSNL